MVGRCKAVALLVFVAVLFVVPTALAEEGDGTTGAPPAPTAPTEPTGPTPPPAPDNSKSTLVLLGGQSAALSVPLSEGSGGELTGTVVLGLRSQKAAGSLKVSYLPSGNAGVDAAGSVALAEGTDVSFKQGGERSIPLVFTLPQGASPEELRGSVVIRSLRKGKAVGHRLELAVSGTRADLTSITIQPEKLEIDVVSEIPTSGPAEESAGIQLLGPGVPKLLATGTTPAFDLLLRSDHGDEVHARLVNLEEGSSAAVATAEVKLEGRLKPGKYEGSAVLSPLSPASPKLTIAVESGNSLLWALLIVLIGSVLGGGVYLASGIRRRKALLRDEVKALLSTYTDVLENAEKSCEGGRLPLWTLDTYLGEDENKWYTVKFHPVLAFDGAVQTIWSDIHWARNEDDLDEVATQVAEMRARIVRWVTVANSIAALQLASKLDAKGIAGNAWEKRKTPKDTKLLLERIREIEPDGEEAGRALIERIKRQARWHVELAEAWKARTALQLDVTLHEDKYDSSIHDTIREFDLEQLDEKASPEAERDAEKQVGFTVELEQMRKRILEVYKGDPKDLKLEQPLPPRSAIAAPTIGVAAAAGPGSAQEAIVEDRVLDSAKRAEPPKQLDASLRSISSSGSTHSGERIEVPVKAIVRRDLLWTIATAVVASAAYVPTIYNSTWGTPTDYLSAFVAGFLGKTAISWAALPLFRSLKGQKSGKSDEATTTKAEGGPAETAAAAPTGDGAATKAGAPASQVMVTIPAVAVSQPGTPDAAPPSAG